MCRTPEPILILSLAHTPASHNFTLTSTPPSDPPGAREATGRKCTLPLGWPSLRSCCPYFWLRNLHRCPHRRSGRVTTNRRTLGAARIITAAGAIRRSHAHASSTAIIIRRAACARHRRLLHPRHRLQRRRPRRSRRRSRPCLPPRRPCRHHRHCLLCHHGRS